MRVSILLSLIFMFSSFIVGESEPNIENKLKQIQNEVPLVYNNAVQNYINVYQSSKKSLTESILAKSEYYFPIFENILSEFGLPDELKYLSVIESALQPKANSKMGARGLWQFMPSTAKDYKLKMNSYIDERSDTELSTRAAALYLQRGYDKFGDWLLVIASYNCGAGNVTKAIRKAGGNNDFWTIFKFLPLETRGYVPAFIAAMYVMKYSDELGLKPNYTNLEYLAYDAVDILKELNVQDLIEKLNLDEQLFRYSNASLNGNIIPDDYKLKLPKEKHTLFHELSDTLYAIAINKVRKVEGKKKEKTYAPVEVSIPTDPNLESILYTIKEGDNLGFISSWFNIGLDNLKVWNGIARNNINIGQEVVVYLPKDKVQFYATFDKLSNRQKNILSSDREKRMLYAKKTDSKFVYHEVKSGETFSTIKNLYKAASVDIIKSLNNIDDRSLRPGMFLKIMKTDL